MFLGVRFSSRGGKFGLDWTGLSDSYLWSKIRRFFSYLLVQAPSRLFYLLGNVDEVEVLLRLVTLLANLTTTATTHKLNPALDLPAADKAASPDTFYAAIYGVNNLERMEGKAKELTTHPDEDVRIQSRRLLNALLNP